MASTYPQQPLLHDTEVSCDSSGEGPVSVRINSTKQPSALQVTQASGANRGSSGFKPFKYSISSSCSSGESGVRKLVRKGPVGARRVPQLFERSAAQFWDPAFDSPTLEEACQERCFPQTQRRFRYVLLYLGAASLVWGVYFGANTTRCRPDAFLAPTAAFLLFCLLLFLFTFSRPYAQLYNQVSLLLITVTFALTLALQAHTIGFHGGDGNPIGEDHALQVQCVSPVGTFSLCIEALLLLYSALHLRLYASVLMGLFYSVLFEVLGFLAPSEREGLSRETLYWLVPARALLHLCAHALGVHLFITSEVRLRSTFLKVGQSVMHGKDLEVEKALKERMIHSVMPRSVADELMKQGDDDSEGAGKRYSAGAAQLASTGASSSSSPKNNKRKKTSIPRAQIIFRPFNMKSMEHVSILFADIVGFTKMSANKSAHALVSLLNDLFGRFDHLCELTHCEKISTLGDCYYCVAGCPEPRQDHAYCCVEMGLGMIQAIEQFCQETGETVDMRVGIHTGTVLCGILGMKRFKFDVWSNDVNLANLMEQLGVAGKVHLSEATAAFLDDRYWCEDGQVAERHGQSMVTDQLKGMKTFLISRRKLELPQCSCAQSGLTVPSSEDGISAASLPNTPNAFQTSSEANAQGHHSKVKPFCASCGVVIIPVEDLTLEEGAVQNGRSEERKVCGGKVQSPLSQSPRVLNGLLSPQVEEAVSSSQTSLYERLPDRRCDSGGTVDYSTLIPPRFKGFRDKNDAHFVKAIKGDSLMKDYFFKPPINKLSLNFLEASLEKAYRTSLQEEAESQADAQTFASPTFSSFLDVLLSCAMFLVLGIACFLRPLMGKGPFPPGAVGFTVFGTLLEATSLLLSIRLAFYLDGALSCTRTLLRSIAGWVPRHFIGAVLVSMPAICVFTHVTCSTAVPVEFAVFLCCAAVIATVHYCNFCQLSFWLRSCLATAVGVVLLVLLHSPFCWTDSAGISQPFGNGNLSNTSMEMQLMLGPESHAQTRVSDLLSLEAILAVFLLLMLVWFLNRELEVGYRLHYHGNVEADRHRIKIQNMRDQADWLLGNIIPMHVADQLKVTQSYSKNHEDVAVIFASIVNFSEFYEESFEGGKECYRVLNELIGDFDDLLRQSAFAHVEKIKTIGATYMAASGLNMQCSKQVDPRCHLRALFDFALEMMRVVDDFNNNMLGFRFKLRIGYNHGPLTAGVIGTTKLLYDIWGDTVNIASRMDSTGVECRIQVSEGSHAELSKMNYKFEYRGTVNVKGKGQMRTFLYPRSTDGVCSSTLCNVLLNQPETPVAPSGDVSHASDTREKPKGSRDTNSSSRTSAIVGSGEVSCTAQVNYKTGQEPVRNGKDEEEASKRHRFHVADHM